MEYQTPDISRSPAGTIDFTVPGVVPGLIQPSDNTCWATVATILVSWRENRSRSIEDVMRSAGTLYLTRFNLDSGLAGSEKPGFRSSLGLRAEAPQNYTASVGSRY